MTESIESLSDQEEAVTSVPSRTRGRHISSVWSFYTNDLNPQLLVKAVCKHCHIIVRHHKKSEKVKSHLNSCQNFRNAMGNINIQDRPEWFTANKRLAIASKKRIDINSHDLQPPITEFMAPKITTAVQAKFEETIAMHYYMTGTSFQRIEEEHFIAALKLLNPNVVLPSRKKLAGPLLIKCYNKVKAKVDQDLKDEIICLITDGWTNILNEPIVNYMVSSPSHAIFLESVETGLQSHSADWMAQDIKRVIDLHPRLIFAGVVTDNTSANKKLWKLLSDFYPSKFFQGCMSQGLSLLVKDIVAATKTRSNSSPEPVYPANYPFESLTEFSIQCKDIVKLFNNSSVLQARLRSLQQSAGIRGIVKPVLTRWGTIKDCCESLLLSESFLLSIVSSREFVQGSSAQKVERSRIKNVIISTDFLPLLNKICSILGPIDRLIVKYQSDSVPISEVLPDFEILSSEFSNLLSNNSMNHRELSYLTLLLQQRLKFMYNKSHGLAYLLDPRYIGKEVANHCHLESENSLVEIPENDLILVDDTRRELLYTQFMAFKAAAHKEKVNNSFRYKMLFNGLKTPLQYWKNDATSWPELRAIAMKLFTLPTSSATAERNFSTKGFLHNKLRNSLSRDTVERLTFIKSNHSASKNRVDDDEQSGTASEDEDFEELIELNLV